MPLRAKKHDIIDGDYSDHSEEISTLVQPFLDREHDLIIRSCTKGTIFAGYKIFLTVFRCERWNTEH